MGARDQEQKDKEIDHLTLDIEKIRQDLKLDNRKFTLQVVATIAGCTIALTAVINVLQHYFGK